MLTPESPVPPEKDAPLGSVSRSRLTLEVARSDLSLQETGAEIMGPVAAKKRSPNVGGRPRTVDPERHYGFTAPKDLVEELERCRERRAKANPGMRVDMSATIRSLLYEALAADRAREGPQPSLPFTGGSTEKR